MRSVTIFVGFFCAYEVLRNDWNKSERILEVAQQVYSKFFYGRRHLKTGMLVIREYLVNLKNADCNDEQLRVYQLFNPLR